MPTDDTPRETTGPGRPFTKNSRGSREAILGLDSTERQLSFVAGVFALAIAAFTAYLWAKNSPTITKVKVAHPGQCPTGYHLVHSMCEKVTRASQGSWEFRFFFIAITGLLILLFTWKKKRAGVATFSIFMGLGNGAFFGPLYLFLGLWLIVRAFRLQRYGDATFKGAGKKSREQAAEKRAQRSERRRSGSTSPTPTSGRSTPEPSKRYTPKRRPVSRRRSR